MRNNFDWKDITICDLLENAANTMPDKLAIVSPGERIRYRQLLEQVDLKVRRLLKAGISPMDRVATLYGSSLEWIKLHLALLEIGAVTIPLNTRFQSKELHNALYQVKATHLFCVDNYGGYNLIPRVRKALPRLFSHVTQKENLKPLTELRKLVCYSASGNRYPGFASMTEIVNNDDRQPRHFSAKEHAQPLDTPIIIFTSGTTGIPKGAMLTHRGLIGHAHYLKNTLDLRADDRYINLLPFFHVAGYSQSVITNLYTGSTLYLPNSFDPDKLVRMIHKERITACAGMPVTIQRILEYSHKNYVDISTIQKVHGASPEMLLSIREAMNPSIVTRMYGLTESSGIVSMTRVNHNPQTNLSTCVGKPLPGISVKIVDPASGDEVPINHNGEITFNGWNLFKGYFGKENNRSNVDAQGYFHTGDKGYIDLDGFLHFLGRYKGIIKTGGENVSQREVEEFIRNEIPGIKRVVVFGVPDKTWGEAVTAVVEPDREDDFRPSFIQSQCKGRIASYKIPKYILLCPSKGWPLSSTGKVDRKELLNWACHELNKEVEL